MELSLREAAEYLGRSEKSISRYIKSGRLKPEKVQGLQNRPEYRFYKADLEIFKAQEEQTRQDTGQRTSQTGQCPHQETGKTFSQIEHFLLEQIGQKDKMIADQTRTIDRLSSMLGAISAKVLQIESLAAQKEPSPLKTKPDNGRALRLLLILTGLAVFAAYIHRQAIETFLKGVL
jgi:excisionase family DNA binding protein